VKIFTSNEKKFYCCGEIYVTMQNIFLLLIDNHMFKCERLLSC